MKPYLVLLQVEFTLLRTVTSRPVRSYRTLSALPVLYHLSISEPSAVFSLLHLSSACAAQALPGTLLIGARTFLPPICLPEGTTMKQRLSRQLGAHSTPNQH